MNEHIDTLVIGAGQAGLATSYWLREAGVEHTLVDGRAALGGSWPDRWDSFCLVAPNFTLLLPGMPYDGPYPDAFMPRDEVVHYVRRYAQAIEAPVRLGTFVHSLTQRAGGFEAGADGVTYHARNVVLATGAYQQPQIPAASRDVSSRIEQLHSSAYRRPAQLPPGAVLVVGSGQSGAQIAEELIESGRDVHLAVSMCGSVPRRYRGRDVIWWLLHSFQDGKRHGVHFPTVADLPSPAARFECHPHVSGRHGGHDIDLRDLALRGVRLYGRLENASGTRVRFTGDLAERLAFAERWFDEQLKPLFDAYIAAAAPATPPDRRERCDTPAPQGATELDLDDAGIRSIVWATGYRPDFSWVGVPFRDEWGYPRHERGVTEHPGLYVIGLPWLYSEPSSVFAGVGADAAHIVEHLARRRASA